MVTCYGPQVAFHNEVKSIVHESYILQLVKHPNVIDLKETIIKNQKLILILEYARHGDLPAVCTLPSLNSALRQRMALHVLHQMAQALDYLHFHNVAHRDIKPVNIVLCDHGTFKVRVGIDVSEPQRISSTSESPQTVVYDGVYIVSSTRSNLQGQCPAPLQPSSLQVL